MVFTHNLQPQMLSLVFTQVSLAGLRWFPHSNAYFLP
jgi:hypothetical protein